MQDQDDLVFALFRAVGGNFLSFIFLVETESVKFQFDIFSIKGQLTAQSQGSSKISWQKAVEGRWGKGR